MADPLLHITTAEIWAQLVADRELEPDEGGFVHLSTPEQVHLPANRLYAGRLDLVLLCLDPAKLSGEVRWEPGVPEDPASMRFPHLYGPLTSRAVVGVVRWTPGPDGFAPPTGLPSV